MPKDKMSKADRRKSKSYLVTNFALTLIAVLYARILDYILLIKSEKNLFIKDLQGFSGVHNFRHFPFNLLALYRPFTYNVSSTETQTVSLLRLQCVIL